MARPRLNTVNFVYTTIGIGIAAGVGYLVWRQLRNRRFATGTVASTDDNLMDIRRSSRKAGRAIKDTGSQIGKAVKRGASDVNESFEDATSSGKELLADTSTGSKYNRI